MHTIWKNIQILLSGQEYQIDYSDHPSASYNVNDLIGTEMGESEIFMKT